MSDKPKLICPVCGAVMNILPMNMAASCTGCVTTLPIGALDSILVKGKVLYVVGHVLEYIEGKGAIWAMVGIFTDENTACRACQYPNSFVGPMEVDKMINGDVEVWKGLKYPFIEGMLKDDHDPKDGIPKGITG